MAASRIDSSRRLCCRYKWYFVAAFLIFSIQLCIFISFNTNQREVTKDEISMLATDYDTIQKTREVNNHFIFNFK